jgi:hypothetical protein
MPVWRCPHCGTPQAEAARCWVCRRSSTSCATCVNFRHAVFGGVGYCGLDRGRSTLAGDEIRPCWVAPMTLMAGAVAVELAPDEQPFSTGGTETGPLTSDRPTRFWVEVEG